MGERSSAGEAAAGAARAGRRARDPGGGARATGRPLLACACALAIGQAAGLAGGPRAAVWGLLAAALAGAALARTASAGAARPGAPLVALGLLGALAGLRASAQPEVAAPLEAPATLEGRWEPRGRGAEGVRGALVAAERLGPIELPAGAARRGERVRLDPSEPPVPPPRGPVRRAGAPRDGVLAARADEVLRLAPPDELAAPWSPLLARVRAAAAGRCAALSDPAAAGVVRALLLGDTARVPAQTSELFVRTGTRHLLAVSGMHVALAALFVLRPLALAAAWMVPRGCRRPWHGRALLALLVLAYVPLAGAGPPVRRAGLALLLAALAPGLPGGAAGPRRADGLSLWSLALALECACDPRALASLGVLLSYAATLGLILAARPLARWLAATRSADGIGAAGAARALRAVVRRWTARAGAAVAASCAAVLATLPLSWPAFGETSPVGILATPLALLPCAWLMLAGWIHALLAEGAAASAWGELALVAPARLLLDLLAACDALPWTPLPLPERPAWAVAGATGLAFAALAARAQRLRVHLGRAALTAWGGLLLPWSAAPAGLELWALDVGHGTAVAARAPGVPCLVFDCGSRDRARVAQEALAPLLARWEVARPLVVLSHDDRDHAAGLSWLVERYPPRLWAGALPAPLGERLPHSAPRLALPMGRLELLDGGPVAAALLRGGDQPGNEGSHSLLLSLEDASVLLCGDAEGEGLAQLLRAGLVEEGLRLLLVPHHGSDSPWLGPLLDRARPREAWISAPERPPAARELERRGIPCRTTAAAGPLELRLGEGSP